MNSQKLKLGLDYHGVINQKPEYFAAFCRLATERGHRIYIITGGPAVKVKQYLAAADISYDFLFAVADYYQALGQVEQRPDGGFEVAEYLWNMAKAEFCRRCRVNLHIDDSIEYLHWFSTPFCLYDRRTAAGYISPGLRLDFTKPPAETLDDIERIAAGLTCFV